MIPSTLLQGILPNTQPEGLSFEKGGDARTGGFANILGRVTAGGEGGEAKGVSGTHLGDGQSFLTELKKEIMASGRSLENYTADGDVLAEFGDILVKLGFDVDEVEEMISALSSRAMGSEVTLADLFSEASQLTEPGEDGSMSVMLNVSAMPDLEIILVGLGLDQKTSHDILSDALGGGKGIDLGALAAGIRRVMADMSVDPETVSSNPAEVLERMRRIGLYADTDASPQEILDELISKPTHLGDPESLGKEGSEAGGIPGSLLLSYLQQLVTPLEDDGGQLQGLIASAGKESGGIDCKVLLSKLVQLRQEAASAGTDPGMNGKAVALGGASDAGNIRPERFAAILESRVAEAVNLRGAAKAASASRPVAEMVSGFVEKVSPAAESTTERMVLPVDLEGDRPFQTSWQPGAKRFAGSGSRQSTAGSVSETLEKDAPGQNAAHTSKQTVSAEGAQRQVSSNLSGADSAEKYSEALHAAGRDKTNRTAEDSRFGTEGFIREMKAGDEAASFGKTMASRNLPGYLLNQVSRQIIRLRNAGENELTLQLKPPHLGRMKLNVEHTASGIKVGIIVESAAAKDMLLSNAHDLKAALADQGLRLDRIDVEAQADFGRSMAQAGRGFDQSSGRKGRWLGRSRADVGGASEGPAVVETGVGEVDSGRLDLVA